MSYWIQTLVLIALGGMLAHAFCSALKHSLKIRDLERQIEFLMKAVAHNTYATTMEQYFRIIMSTGKCPECGVRMSDKGIVHTEDCKVLKLMHQAAAIAKMLSEGEKS